MKRVFRLFPPRRQTIKEKRIAERFTRSPEGHIVVNLRLDSPTDLLMPFEGFPHNFGNEAEHKLPPVLNLNKEFVEYLFGRIADLDDESLLLRINLTAESAEQPESMCSANILHTAIHRYFSYLEEIRRQDLQRLAWDAALLGILGAAALGLSVFLESTDASADAGIGLLLLNQGVTVFGWLTLWEALANVLWHWRPLYQQLRMCQRLQLAKLDLNIP